MTWEFKQGIPLYRQLVRRLEIRIAAGAWQPDEKIPPVRELAIEAGVNPNTMQRALAELSREGLLYTERTAGRFVTSDRNKLAQLRQDLAANYIQDLFRNLQNLGLTPDEIEISIHEWKEKEVQK